MPSDSIPTPATTVTVTTMTTVTTVTTVTTMTTMTIVTVERGMTIVTTVVSLLPVTTTTAVIEVTAKHKHTDNDDDDDDDNDDDDNDDDDDDDINMKILPGSSRATVNVSCLSRFVWRRQSLLAADKISPHCRAPGRSCWTSLSSVGCRNARHTVSTRGGAGDVLIELVGSRLSLDVFYDVLSAYLVLCRRANFFWCSVEHPRT